MSRCMVDAHLLATKPLRPRELEERLERALRASGFKVERVLVSEGAVILAGGRSAREYVIVADVDGPGDPGRVVRSVLERYGKPEVRVGRRDAPGECDDRALEALFQGGKEPGEG
ncbi:MAG: hypothetical protein ABGY09_05375 [Euryarchaeota archaeon]